MKNLKQYIQYPLVTKFVSSQARYTHCPIYRIPYYYICNILQSHMHQICKYKEQFVVKVLSQVQRFYTILTLLMVYNNHPLMLLNHNKKKMSLYSNHSTLIYCIYTNLKYYRLLVYHCKILFLFLMAQLFLNHLFVMHNQSMVCLYHVSKHYSHQYIQACYRHTVTVLEITVCQQDQFSLHQTNNLFQELLAHMGIGKKYPMYCDHLI